MCEKLKFLYQRNQKKEAIYFKYFDARKLLLYRSEFYLISRNLSFIKSILEEYLPGIAAFVLDRGLLLFVFRGNASGPDAIRRCT